MRSRDHSKTESEHLSAFEPEILVKVRAYCQSVGITRKIDLVKGPKSKNKLYRDLNKSIKKGEISLEQELALFPDSKKRESYPNDPNKFEMFLMSLCNENNISSRSQLQSFNKSVYNKFLKFIKDGIYSSVQAQKILPVHEPVVVPNSPYACLNLVKDLVESRGVDSRTSLREVSQELANKMIDFVSRGNIKEADYIACFPKSKKNTTKYPKNPKELLWFAKLALCTNDDSVNLKSIKRKLQMFVRNNKLSFSDYELVFGSGPKLESSQKASYFLRKLKRVCSEENITSRIELKQRFRSEHTELSDLIKEGALSESDVCDIVPFSRKLNLPVDPDDLFDYAKFVITSNKYSSRTQFGKKHPSLKKLINQYIGEDLICEVKYLDCFSTPPKGSRRWPNKPKNLLQISAEVIKKNGFNSPRELEKSKAGLYDKLTNYVRQGKITKQEYQNLFVKSISLESTSFDKVDDVVSCPELEKIKSVLSKKLAKHEKMHISKYLQVLEWITAQPKNYFDYENDVLHWEYDINYEGGNMMMSVVLIDDFKDKNISKFEKQDLISRLYRHFEKSFDYLL